MEYIFSSIWTYIGFVLILIIVFEGIIDIIRAIKSKPKDNDTNTQNKGSNQHNGGLYGKRAG